jgi:hypothetical protein
MISIHIGFKFSNFEHRFYFELGKNISFIGNFGVQFRRLTFDWEDDVSFGRTYLHLTFEPNKKYKPYFILFGPKHN